MSFIVWVVVSTDWNIIVCTKPTQHRTAIDKHGRPHTSMHVEYRRLHQYCVQIACTCNDRTLSTNKHQLAIKSNEKTNKHCSAVCKYRYTVTLACMKWYSSLHWIYVCICVNWSYKTGWLVVHCNLFMIPYWLYITDIYGHALHSNLCLWVYVS